MYCPAWIYDIASARVAFEFLHSEMPLETYAAKYSQGLSDTYSDIPAESLIGAAQGMLEFLAEIEAGENAALLLSHFTYHRLYYAGVAMPRKMKPMVWIHRRRSKAEGIFRGTGQEGLPRLCLQTAFKPRGCRPEQLEARG